MVCIDIRPTSYVTAPRKYQIHSEQVWVYITLGQSKDAYMYTYLAIYPICTGTKLILYGVAPRKDMIHNAGMGLHLCRENNLYVCNKIISALCDIAPRKHRIQNEQVGYTSPWDNQLTPICV